MRRPAAVIAALTAVLATSCSGPGDRIEIGSKDIPVDIVLGDQRAQAPPLPPGGSPVTGFPGFIAPPHPDLPFIPPPPPPPPQRCPLANPLDASELVANKRAPKPPVPATYVYRNEGTMQVGDGVEISFPPEQTRTVQAVAPDGDGNFSFDVAATLLGVTTTTTYRVLNTGATPDRGIYLRQTVTRMPNGDTEAFTPDQPLLIMPFPPPEYGTNLEDEIDRQRGADYRSTGTDPLTQTTMVLQARIDGKDRANACGEWVDAYNVEIVAGKILGPTKNIDFTGNYLVAPQYGGLIVADDLTFSGTEDLVGFRSHNVATINAVPRA